MGMIKDYFKYLWLYRKGGIKIPLYKKIEMGFYSYLLVVILIRLIVNIYFI